MFDATDQILRQLRASEDSIDVVDEAVVNAVAHRDYSVYGSKIPLFLSPTAWRSTARAACRTASRWTRCPTGHSPATSFS